MTDRFSLPDGYDETLSLSSVLADPRQRRLLSLLLERSESVSAEKLAVELAAQEAADPTDRDDAAVRTVLIDVRHRCLPKLERLGWVEWDDRRVVTTDEFPLDDADARPRSGNSDVRLPALDRGDVHWEALGAVLAHPRRQHLVSVLAHSDRPCSLEDVAAQLHARSTDSDSRGEHEAPTDLSTTLHHVDLPLLDDLGLVRYDPEEKTVGPDSELLRIREWIDVDAGPGPDRDGGPASREPS